MTRRQFIALLGGAALARPLVARAQQGTMRRIGVLMGYAENDPQSRGYTTTLVSELQNLGWHDGRSAKIDIRWAGGDIERIQAFAQELVELKPDVLLANTTPVALALQQRTRTIPIVFVIVSDPVGAGLVEGLPRPGGNVTGFINLEASMGGKWLGLLKDMAPRIARAAIMFNPETAPGAGSYFLPSFETAAAALKIEPIPAPVRNDSDIERVVATLAREPAGGLVVSSDGFMQVHRHAIIALAARAKVPAIYPTGRYPEDGGLMGFGQDTMDIFRRAAPYIDRILRGDKPADLPVQVPVKFELVINANTAKALGLELPLSLQVAADRVIE